MRIIWLPLTFAAACAHAAPSTPWSPEHIEHTAQTLAATCGKRVQSAQGTKIQMMGTIKKTDDRDVRDRALGSALEKALLGAGLETAASAAVDANRATHAWTTTIHGQVVTTKVGLMRESYVTAEVKDRTSGHVICVHMVKSQAKAKAGPARTEPTWVPGSELIRAADKMGPALINSRGLAGLAKRLGRKPRVKVMGVMKRTDQRGLDVMILQHQLISHAAMSDRVELLSSWGMPGAGPRPKADATISLWINSNASQKDHPVLLLNAELVTVEAPSEKLYIGEQRIERAP